MYSVLKEALIRQEKALDLMQELLKEEFSYLRERNTDAIMTIEFSIHELLRQLASEKESIIRFLGGGKLRDYVEMLCEENKTFILDLYKVLEKKEQLCAKQASRNTQLALGLLDQSKDMLNFLHERIIPPQKISYSRRGVYAQSRPQASLINGRL